MIERSIIGRADEGECVHDWCWVWVVPLDVQQFACSRCGITEYDWVNKTPDPHRISW